MTDDNFGGSSQWYWKDLCGAGGLNIWSPQRHDLGLCFQQFCLQIPALVIFASISAYYFGREVEFVSRGRIQLIAINLRCMVIAILTFLPVVQIYIDLYESDGVVEKISYFLSAVQGITWFTHLGYTWSLRYKLGLSPRGPILICIIWSLIFVLNVISVRSHYFIFKYSISPNYSIYLSYQFSICNLILQVLYGLTLIPGEGDTHYIDFNTQQSESQPLLFNNYHRFLEEHDPSYLGTAMENANWLSKLTFYWVNPLIEKGIQGKLNNADDLYDLPISLTSGSVSLKLNKALAGKIYNKRSTDFLENSSSYSGSTIQTAPDVSYMNLQKPSVSLIVALHKCFWLQFYSIGFLKLAADCAGFAGPMLLNKLVTFIEDKSEEVQYGYIYASSLFAVTFLAAFCNSHFNFLMSIVGLKIRASLVTTIYRKTLTVSSTVLNSAFSVGEIVNFMSTDTDRIINSCPSFHALWSIPLQIAVTLYLLYMQVGLAFVAGVIFTLLLIPVNKIIANKIGDLSKKLMTHKDTRVKILTEVLRGIKTIKLHVWEQHFSRIISKVREDELKYLKGRKYLDALCVYFWATTPVLISILTFGTYILIGNKLTAATVFTSIALFNMLISPLNAFPWVLNGLTEAWISIKRIQKLLDLPDLDFETYYDDTVLDNDPCLDLILENASFTWEKSLTPLEREALHSPRKNTRTKGKRPISMLKNVAEENFLNFSLQNLNVKIKKGEFVGVVGTVGCGKTSLLSALIAEINKIDGKIGIKELERGFGFVSQQPWLQRGTVRDNILFGRSYDESKYRTVLYVCGLSEDIASLPAGDMTGVGEGGMTLSGGQKARVSLARAVYQDKPIYLFDDIISAVDVNVAKHIIQHCVLDFLKNKTRILCTHHFQHLINADRILLLENGQILQQGKPAEVFSNLDDSLPVDLELGESMQSEVTSSTLTESIKLDEAKDDDSILNEEFREMGNLQLNVYISYWKAIGHLLALSILLSMILMQTSRNMTDWWLSYWVTNSEATSSNSTNSTNNFTHTLVFSAKNIFASANNTSISYYMTVYAVFACLNSLFTLIRAFLFAYGGVVAASKIHKLLLRSVLKAKVTFFDVSPLGRILNRFSSDTYTVDDSLPFIMNILLAQTFGLVGSIVITIYGLPWLCLILVPLIPIYHWLQYRYRLTSRELKRLSSVTLSPVYSHFNESLQGLATIRALRATQRFKRDNEENLEANQKSQFASNAAAQWLGLRLQFMGVAIVTGVSFIAAIQHQYDVADPGFVGLAITYALSVTSLLSGVVNAFTETEREMIAVERVNQYIEGIEPETTYFVCDPPYAWPSQGVITFKSVTLKYREHLPPSLKSVSFETRPAEKIGVVGRTGAGKSSLLAALFRMVEIHSGSVFIDSVNISSISLSALRSRLWCIPQDPFLFSGTVRENLDPLNEFRDVEITSALARVGIFDKIVRLGGLDYIVSSGGSNLSAGQRQLLCLARAILINAKILCIDEATANVDHETDRSIQMTLRSAFRKSTVITIAHRVHTIMDCDRILVINDGEVIEFDTPDNLLSDSSSHFYQLVNQE